MNLHKLCLVVLLSVSIFGCAPKSDSNINNRVTPKMFPFGSCIPESDLLASNIIRGDVVKAGDADTKAVAALIVENSVCTAVAIEKDVLLTAAHCVGSTEVLKSLVIYHHSMSCESGYSPAQHAIKTKKIVRHQGYDFKKEIEDRRDDVALVFLDGNVPDGAFVYKIADPAKVSATNQLYLYGYGKTSGQGGGSGILRRAIVERKNFSINIDQNLVVINQQTGSGICRGDSGGPSLALIDKEPQILGINSFVMGENGGNVCSASGFQTLAHSYLGWISSEISAYREDIPKR
jgi:secreted trypsin-like serine protease